MYPCYRAPETGTVGTCLPALDAYDYNVTRSDVSTPLAVPMA
jgi:hypothetical protein